MQSACSATWKGRLPSNVQDGMCTNFGRVILFLTTFAITSWLAPRPADWSGESDRGPSAEHVQKKVREHDVLYQLSQPALFAFYPRTGFVLPREMLGMPRC